MGGVSMVFTAELWEYEGPSAWHFVTLPPECADQIAEHARPSTNGFGSVRVEARIGATRWLTSVFPDATRGTYLLPVKKDVRKAECLVDGSPVTVELAIV